MAYTKKSFKNLLLDGVGQHGPIPSVTMTKEPDLAKSYLQRGDILVQTYRSVLHFSRTPIVIYHPSEVKEGSYWSLFTPPEKVYTFSMVDGEVEALVKTFNTKYNKSGLNSVLKRISSGWQWTSIKVSENMLEQASDFFKYLDDDSLIFKTLSINEDDIGMVYKVCKGTEDVSDKSETVYQEYVGIISTTADTPSPFYENLPLSSEEVVQTDWDASPEFD